MRSSWVYVAGYTRGEMALLREEDGRRRDGNEEGTPSVLRVRSEDASNTAEGGAGVKGAVSLCP